MNNKFTPPDHIKFLAEKLYGELGEITDVSIAEIEKDGGGPRKAHTHPHDHLFIVTKGEAVIHEGDKTVTLKRNEVYLTDGKKPHSVWNTSCNKTIMLGINIIPKNNERKI